MTIHLQKGLILFLLAMLSIFLLMKIWDKGNEVDSSERDQDLEARIERLQNAEQYALFALRDGYYPCSHCSGRSVWLNKDEVAKYGVSINPNGRYTDEYLRENKVYYFTQFTGTLAWFN